MTTPATKIVIVSGQEFSVPADTDVEQIRTLLKGDFPDVATATVQKGKRKIDGVEVETIEFVKKAGTKGADIDLGALLGRVPAAPPPSRTSASYQVRQLLAGGLTAQEAVDAGDALLNDLNQLGHGHYPSQKEVRLCSKLDTLEPVAAPHTPHGW